jgi:hypothetical protein
VDPSESYEPPQMAFDKTRPPDFNNLRYIHGEEEIRQDEREKIAKAIELVRNEHWQEHLRKHPYADSSSCPRDYGMHDAFHRAATIARNGTATQTGGPPVMPFGQRWKELTGQVSLIGESDDYLQFSFPDCPHSETQLRRKEIHKKYQDPRYKHVEVCLVCGNEVREW